MQDWIEDKIVNQALKEESKKEIEKTGVKFCISNDFQYCILVRKHHAWEIEGEGWRDRNLPPELDDTWRWTLNFYHFEKATKNSWWFKMFVPLKYKIVKIEQVDDEYKIITDLEIIIGKFSSYYILSRNVLTGNAETEEEIERKFLDINEKN